MQREPHCTPAVLHGHDRDAGRVDDYVLGKAVRVDRDLVWQIWDEAECDDLAAPIRALNEPTIDGDRYSGDARIDDGKGAIDRLTDSDGATRQVDRTGIRELIELRAAALRRLELRQPELCAVRACSVDHGFAV